MALDLQGFKRTLVYQTSLPAAAVQSDIEQVRGLDRISESLERRWRIAMVLAWILAGVLLLVGAARAEGGTGTLWLVCGGLVLIGAIVATVKKRTYARLNLADRRYELVNGLLGLIKTDLGQAEPVTLRLDLTRPDLKAKFSGKGEAGAWKVAHYTDPWLDLQGRLLDGTRFHFTATERFQQRRRWKRSTRGKMKRKTKTRSATRFGLDLVPKETRFPGLEAAASTAGEAVRLPAQFALKGVQVAGGRLALKVAVEDAWTAPGPGCEPSGPDGVEAGALMFLSLYEILRRAARPGGA